MSEQRRDEELAGVESRHISRSRALPEGAHFGVYVIQGLLGSGAMARVYRARHPTLGHEVALKVFEPRAAPNAAALARFFREAQQAAALRHPHVVRTIDAGVQEGLPFLVMELLEGRDLETRLRSERAVEELALIELAIPIVAGLMALHAQGLVHGDLGPGNVFLVSAPHGPDVPKLLDVAISKPHQGLRLTTAARQRSMGSPLYLAPEAMLGRELTPASDQYSLGMILYECVTGVNPFVSTSLKESVRLILSGKRLPVLEQSIAPSPGLASIIERASSVAPEARFPDLASLGRALLRLADQRTRAAWEFSFQSVGGSPSSLAAPAGAGGRVRWKAAAIVAAVLGWGTAGALALQAAQRESGEQYMLFGAPPSPSPAELPEQGLLALRAPSAAPAPVAPCVPGASNALEAAATGAGHAPSASPAPAPLLDESSVPELREVPAIETPAAIETPLELTPSAGSLPLAEPKAPLAPQGPTSHLTPRGTNNAPIFE